MAGAAVLLYGIVAPASFHRSLRAADLPSRGQEIVAAESGRVPLLTVPEPSVTNLVTAAAVLVPPPGAVHGSATLFVKIRIASGHYIYALERSGSVNLPTAVTVPIESGLRPRGPWKAPEPRHEEDGPRTYSGEVLLERSFALEHWPARPNVRIPIEIRYQVCSEALCWPPAALRLEVPFSSSP